MQLIGLAGGSGSGKTSVAAELATLIGRDRVSIVSLDDYYFHPKVFGSSPDVNWDSPDALDFKSIRADLAALREGSTIRTPFDSRLYEQEHGDPVTKGPEIAPRDFVVAEGLYALYDAAVLSITDYSIYLQCDPRLRLTRQKHRIFTEEYVEKIHVPTHNQFVEPTSANADLIIATDDKSPLSIAALILEHIQRDDPGILQ